MLKAMGSKFDIINSDITKEYYNAVCDLLNNDIITEMKNYTHHYSTTCFQHSLNVSYYNFLLCKRFGLDAKSAARGGLLHDLFLYNRKTYIRQKGEKLHGFRHPHIALKNAEDNFELNKIEKDIIVKHMWPLTIKIPRHPETFVICLVDKYCGLIEVSQHIAHRLIRIFRKRKFA